jgi:epoxyqueuosine reductase QueG
MDGLDRRLEEIAREMGADFFGVADLVPLREEIRRQGGDEVASYPRAVSFGIRLLDSIVDRLPERLEEPAVSVNYLNHCYDTVNTRLDLIASRLGGVLQQEGHRVLPLPSSERHDSVRICAQFSHKLAARQAGMGWIGKSCLLVTPEAGPRVRWNSVLTDAPLIPTGSPMEEKCGKCSECVETCPPGAFTGRAFIEGEPREARYDARKCERYFQSMNAAKGRAACGLCLYACPFGRSARRGRPAP